MDERLDKLLDRCLLLDLETGPNGAMHKIGSVRGGAGFLRQRRFDQEAALGALDAFATDAEFLLGHNLLGHDLPCLRSLAPELGLRHLPVVDSLYLSPLAFPENPYHRLMKDYKLVRDGLSDPVADARLAARVFSEQWEELRRRSSLRDQDLLSLYRFGFQGATGLGLEPAAKLPSSPRQSTPARSETPPGWQVTSSLTSLRRKSQSASATQAARYTLFWLRIAQPMRAILLASATTALL